MMTENGNLDAEDDQDMPWYLLSPPKSPLPLTLPLTLFRHLTAEISHEWQEMMTENAKLAADDDQDMASPVAGDLRRHDFAMRQGQLNALIQEIVPYLMSHNGEAEACDFMMEVDQLKEFVKYVEAGSQPRVCLYLKRLVFSVRGVSYLRRCGLFKGVCL